MEGKVKIRTFKTWDDCEKALRAHVCAQCVYVIEDDPVRGYFGWYCDRCGAAFEVPVKCGKGRTDLSTIEDRLNHARACATDARLNGWTPTEHH
ncbi:MAG: hypothetical protein JSS66_07810 [Armatimonadetes bacterium]|nr:hypothetical protein [Armatimonadota bacterium]